jgi:hypothetical protein
MHLFDTEARAALFQKKKVHELIGAKCVVLQCWLNRQEYNFLMVSSPCHVARLPLANTARIQRISLHISSWQP